MISKRKAPFVLLLIGISQLSTGAPNIRLAVVRRIGHSNPCRNEVSKAIEFLDSGENELH